jgi:hypothetical protein
MRLKCAKFDVPARCCLTLACGSEPARLFVGGDDMIPKLGQRFSALRIMCSHPSGKTFGKIAR